MCYNQGRTCKGCIINRLLGSNLASNRIQHADWFPISVYLVGAGLQFSRQHSSGWMNRAGHFSLVFPALPTHPVTSLSQLGETNPWNPPPAHQAEFFVPRRAIESYERRGPLAWDVYLSIVVGMFLCDGNINTLQMSMYIQVIEDPYINTVNPHV